MASQPRKIGPYEIVEELGRGGMGVVYRAFDPAIGRPLAIKLLHMPHLPAEDLAEMRQRFAREAAAAGRLSHPGIVTLYQFGEDGDSQYIAMELIPGGSLDSLMRDGQPWAAPIALCTLRQIAEALDYAHRNGVVHRDIKPANVLIQPDGRAKVTDFGIARIATQTVTKSGSAIGTPAYMAPEQIQGQKVDARADQFSLAIVAFQMLTGKPPFTAETDYALLYQIVNGEPASLSELNMGIPTGADAVMRRALAKNSNARFASCADFLAALEDAILGPGQAATAELTRRSIVLPPPTTPAKKGRNWLPLLAAVALVAAGLAWFLSRPPAPRPIAATESRPSQTAVPPPVPPAAPSRDGLTHVLVPHGTFMMGCSPGDSECEVNENPPRQVTISKGFRIGKTLVTQAAYQQITGNTPSHFPGPDLPVENVTWYDARNYCQTIGMRLPTEAEWEYAARAGSPSRRYGDLDTIAWYLGNSDKMTHPVGQKPPNAWGLYDMLGNVWEWTSDWYADHYPDGPGTDPQGPDTGTFRVMRGGSWDNPARLVRASSRGGNLPDHPVSWTGFRCVGN
jgi:serine/threonine-protein kinase